MRRILVTGGAGFIGSSVALALARAVTGVQVCAFDNLQRRGSELAPDRLRAGGVPFFHGDVRVPSDLAAAGPCDLLIDCAADPSVKAGEQGDAAAAVATNLVGTANCLEVARQHGAAFLFFSTSRVYAIEALRRLPLAREGDRLDIPSGCSGTGWSRAGISDEFSTRGVRSLYGATKLAAELLVEEYGAAYQLHTVTNRCGVVSGPWQMGKADQGVVALWAARHLWGDSLRYIGFDGHGLQVRDVLHIDDLCELIVLQVGAMARLSGQLFCVGGGAEHAVSLAELTALCAEATGRRIPVRSEAATARTDVPWYVTDNQKVIAATGWRPARAVRTTVTDVVAWLRNHAQTLQPILG